MSRSLVVALAFLAAAPVAAQAPAGWHERLDRSTSASDPDNTPDVKFASAGKGFQVTTGPAVVLWKDANTASGNFTLSGRFRLVKPSGHTNYYGLVFAASKLTTSEQSYLYFIVAQNGTFTIKHRAGDTETHEIVPRTPHAAIAKPDASGSSTNTLEVRAGATMVDFVVNGQVVQSLKRSDLSPDGTWGIRVNHQLDVQVDELGVKK